MREAIAQWVSTFPRNPGWRDGTFANAGEKVAVTEGVPNALKPLLRDRTRYLVEGSAGQGDWTKTPWVAVLDQSITTTTQEGFYLVYLLSHGCERLYCVLGQGCTRLKDESGIPTAREELRRRAAVMRQRLSNRIARLKPIDIDLNATGWRADLYEASGIVGCEYSANALPQETDLIADFHEAMALYKFLARDGGWNADDEIAHEAEEDGVSGTLDYQKSYRLHRRAERNHAHSRLVKKHHKPVCAACGFETKAHYHVVPEERIDILEAHHLIPLSRLADGEDVRFDITKDFALLCPNCHRMIHKLGAEKLDELRKLARRNPLDEKNS